ncbi:MAG: acyl-CoA dehydrogenase family protein [Actinomycetota bacterium]
MKLSQEQQSFVEAIRDFTKREAGSREQRNALSDGGREPHNQELYEKVADLGWLGVGIPEEYGGAGGGMVDMCLFLEETGRAQLPIAAYGVTAIVGGAYQRFGTEEQKKEILGGIVAGRTEAIAMSEPDSGSDVGSMKCKAERRDGGFVINGHKTWISGAHHADHILLVCRTDASGSKHEGLSMISVPRETAGVEIRPIETMGGREQNDVFFNDCFVPAENVLGEVDQAWMQLMAGLNVERLIIAAMILGIGQRAFDDTLAYVKERKQFGRPIGSFQVLKHRIADMEIELECARLLVYDVASKVDEDPTVMFPREASMAKIKATEVAKHVAIEGMQMMGGNGYTTEYDMERYVRQTIVSTVYGGTSEIQREIVSKTYGL